MLTALDVMHKLLGILSPEEIAELTTSSQGDRRVPLTDLMFQKTETSSAKILAFKKPESEENLAKNENLSKTSDLKTPDEGKNSLDEEESIGQIKTKNDQLDVEEMSATVLIIQVKNKLRQTQEKLKEKEIIDLYKSGAKIDINQEKLSNSDLGKSTNLGILINKKQN